MYENIHKYIIILFYMSHMFYKSFLNYMYLVKHCFTYFLVKIVNSAFNLFFFVVARTAPLLLLVKTLRLRSMTMAIFNLTYPLFHDLPTYINIFYWSLYLFYILYSRKIYSLGKSPPPPWGIVVPFTGI